MKRSVFAYFLLATVLMTACLPLACTPKKQAVKTTPEQDLKIYYVGVDSLNLYPKPDSDTAPLDVLSLNTKLLRYTVEKGYARVRVVETGAEGWVNNGLLEWKKVKVAPKPKPKPKHAKTQKQEPAEEAQQEPMEEVEIDRSESVIHENF